MLGSKCGIPILSFILLIFHSCISNLETPIHTFLLPILSLSIIFAIEQLVFRGVQDGGVAYQVMLVLLTLGHVSVG